MILLLQYLLCLNLLLLSCFACFFCCFFNTLVLLCCYDKQWQYWSHYRYHLRDFIIFHFSVVFGVPNVHLKMSVPPTNHILNVRYFTVSPRPLYEIMEHHMRTLINLQSCYCSIRCCILRHPLSRSHSIINTISYVQCVLSQPLLCKQNEVNTNRLKRVYTFAYTLVRYVDGPAVFVKP